MKRHEWQNCSCCDHVWQDHKEICDRCIVYSKWTRVIWKRTDRFSDCQVPPFSLPGEDIKLWDEEKEKYFFKKELTEKQVWELFDKIRSLNRSRLCQ